MEHNAMKWGFGSITLQGSQRCRSVATVAVLAQVLPFHSGSIEKRGKVLLSLQASCCTSSGRGGKMQLGEKQHDFVQLTASHTPSCHLGSSLFRLPARAVAIPHSPIYFFFFPFPPRPCDIAQKRTLQIGKFPATSPQKCITASLYYIPPPPPVPISKAATTKLIVELFTRGASAAPQLELIVIIT